MKPAVSRNDEQCSSNTTTLIFCPRTYTDNSNISIGSGKQGSESTGPLGLGGDARRKPGPDNNRGEFEHKHRGAGSRLFAPGHGGLARSDTVDAAHESHPTHDAMHIQLPFMPALAVPMRCYGSSRTTCTNSPPAPLSVAPPTLPRTPNPALSKQMPSGLHESTLYVIPVSL